MQPPILAGEAPQARLRRIGNAGGDRFCENFSEMGKVIRMNRSVCAPVLQLFQRPATIFEDLAIDSFDLTIRGQDPNQTRYPVNSRTQTSLAFTQRLLHAFA